MIACVRKSFDEIPAVVCLFFFHTVNGEGSWIPLPVILTALKALAMCFSEGDSKLESLPQTNPNTKKIYRYPRSLGEVSHEGENKEAGEEIISLDTDRKIRGPGLVLKSNPPEVPILLFSASTSHDKPLEKYLRWINRKANRYKSWHFLSGGLIDWFFWKKVHMLNLFCAAALRSYDKSAALLKDCSKETCAECGEKKKKTLQSRE